MVDFSGSVGGGAGVVAVGAGPGPKPNHSMLAMKSGATAKIKLTAICKGPDFGSGGCEFESCSGYHRSRRSGAGRMAKSRVQHRGPQAVDFEGSAVHKQLLGLGFVSFNLG